MKIFLHIGFIILPILLIFSVFRKANGVDYLSFDYFLNTLSFFDFDFEHTKELIEYLSSNFKYVFDVTNITGVVDFFTWLGEVFSYLFIQPLNLGVQLIRDISSTLSSIFTIIFRLLGLV